MAGEWESKTLAELAAHTERPFAMGPFGSNIRAENYRVSGVPVIRGLNLSDPGGPRFIDSDFVFLSEEKADELSSSNAFPGDLVFVAQGTIGKVGLIPLEGRYKRYVLSQNLMKASIAPDAADPMFVFYYFRSQAGQHEILSRANPTGVPCISRPLTSLKSFEVSLPALPEQQAIAHILGALDDKIELNRRMNETLEGIAQAIFKSWFVDFDPVRAKAAGQQPSGLAPHIADLFPDEFEASELREIPKGWRTTGLQALATLKKQSVKPMQAPVRLWEHYSIPAFDAGQAPVIEAGATVKSSKYRVPPTSVLVSKLNPQFPRVWLPDVQDEEAAICSTEFMPFVPLHDAWRPYLYELMKSDTVQQGIQGRVTGSTGSRQRARPEDVAVIHVVVPGLKLIEAFGRAVGPLHEKVLACVRESHTLAALRDALLPKLVSGELRASDAETFLSEAFK